ncbi:MAG TPA: D-glycerate dehydrogenase [Burkholderiaceae bacterium]|nr:D-glycerate dehydrogenase [Burkholderiaceae bacterium]
MTTGARPRVVVSRRIFQRLIDELRADFEVTDNQSDAMWSAADLARALRDSDGAVLMAGDRVDETLLAQSPRLKIVANVAVGYNNFDLEACTRHGVLATNTPDVLNEATADHAWALLLAAARRVAESERWLRAGLWKRWTFEMFMGAELAGTTLGIVGMGRIGRAIARRASGFRMRVLYHNRTRLAPELEEGAQLVGFEDLLQAADHVMLVVPYSAAVHHLIGAAALARMKPGAVLVNIARGGVVDDAALVAALRNGRLAAAGLDVFENEPALHPGLMELESVVMTPHIASGTRATRAAMAQLAIENLRAALRGYVPPSLLNREVLHNRRG